MGAQKTNVGRDDRPSREDYTRANWFLYLIRTSSMPPDKKLALRRQAIHGDLKGAQNAYMRLMQAKSLAGE